MCTLSAVLVFVIIFCFLRFEVVVKVIFGSKPPFPLHHTDTMGTVLLGFGRYEIHQSFWSSADMSEFNCLGAGYFLLTVLALISSESILFFLLQEHALS